MKRGRGSIGPILAIIGGILIFVYPNLLATVIALYLIIRGALDLFA